MPLYTGDEFNDLKGVQGNAIKLVWSYIKDKFVDYYIQIGVAIGNESAIRALAVQNLQAQITSMKIITAWNPANTFPTKKPDGSNFEAGNFVRITDSVGAYKAGDMLIAKNDIVGDATIADFGDVETNIELATDAFAGVVKIIADKAAYEGVATDTAVVTKIVLQQVLAGLANDLTTAFSNADQAIKNEITQAYNQAISTTIEGYYSKTEINEFLGQSNSKFSSFATYLKTEMWGAIANTLQKIPTLSDVISVVVAHPSLANSLVGTCILGQRPFLYFTKEGFKLSGKEIASTATTWADIADANKADFDYVLVKNPVSFIYSVFFNPEIYTQEVVQTFSVCQLIYAETTVATAMSLASSNPYDKHVGGEDTADATVNLDAQVFPILLS